VAKNLKLNIKNTQIAEAINLDSLKSKLAQRKAEEIHSEAVSEEKSVSTPKKTSSKSAKAPVEPEAAKVEAPRAKARSKSAFAEPSFTEPLDIPAPIFSEEKTTEVELEPVIPIEVDEDVPVRMKSSAEIRKELFGSEEIIQQPPTASPVLPLPIPKPNPHPQQLGPTGRHVKDLIKPKPVVQPAAKPAPVKEKNIDRSKEVSNQSEKPKEKAPVSKAPATTETKPATTDDLESKKSARPSKFKEFKDVKPAKRQETSRFDARDRQGLRNTEEDKNEWRKRRAKQKMVFQEDLTIRPTSLKIRTPISIKDLASEMKLKASQLIAKLFLQGLVVTLNDLLDDETTIQLLGHEFGCDIQIDTTQEARIRITSQSIKEELQKVPADQLQSRPPIVAFMGHVDHGKTSLIDSIRKSNRVAGEAGAITQHIGAFRCHTAVGDITILDTPGHEAFSAMRARGANVTDIVVLVVAGDEGIKIQTVEAIEHARTSNVTIVVAINKCDKPNFNVETVYRQLADNNLLPEAWGGQVITINCSAVTGEGIKELLEMLALQSQVLELRSDPVTRARGTVLESEMHKGLGSVSTVLVQNGTLRYGDAVVFGNHWGRIKTMHNEYNVEIKEAAPSTPVKITGLSGLPEAGEEFVVVKNEREAREIANMRLEGTRQSSLLLQQKRKISVENMVQQASEASKKILNLILRTDVQGSLEALKNALTKIKSAKVDLNIISAAVGEISESDAQLASTSKAVILGFHTAIESHTEPLLKELGITYRLHDIIYHAVDDVKLHMKNLLDKIAIETERGKAMVKALFKSSHTGLIAGCQVTEGVVQRNNHIRVKRANEVIWKGTISSLKRVKEDVKEVQKGIECGILLHNFSALQENDIIEAYEITYITQEL
jgi:translation initiation factor IF-2